MPSLQQASYKIKVGSQACAVISTSNGKYLLSDFRGTRPQAWRLRDGQEIARMRRGMMRVDNVSCIAVSDDGTRIAAGTQSGYGHVWDAETYEQVSFLDGSARESIHGIDFSPDSTQLAMASADYTATLWDIATRKQTRRFEHDDSVEVVKYSSQANQIATATRKHIRVWRSNDGELLVVIPYAPATPSCLGLAWSGSYFFVTFDDNVIRVEASTGLAVPECLPPVRDYSCIAFSPRWRLLAYSTKRTIITIWDTSSYTQLSVINHTQDIHAIAFLPDNPFIVIIAKNGAIAVTRLYVAFEKMLSLHSPTPQALLSDYVKSRLINDSWMGTLSALSQSVIPRFALYRAICETLHLSNKAVDAVECFRHMNEDSHVTGETCMMDERTAWSTHFSQRCIKTLHSLGDASVVAKRHDDAIDHYSIALSLNDDSAIRKDILVKRAKAYIANLSWKDAWDDISKVIEHCPWSPWDHEYVLNEWAKVKLTNGSWMNALSTITFEVTKFTVCQVLCKHLETINCVIEATECFHESIRELGQDIAPKQTKWMNDFKSRNCKELEHRGDTAMTKLQYKEAISLYSTAFRLDPTTPEVLFVKRSKAYAAETMWEDALNDADDAIALDQTSPAGHERRYMALRGAGYYQDALCAFKTMFERMSEAHNEDIRVRYHKYVSTREDIRNAVQDAVRKLPRVLINTMTGNLCNRSQQATAFESSSTFVELMESMVSQVDKEHIKQEVASYYRYATFSHKWEDHEPLFEKLMQTAVYNLEVFPTHEKLRTFCEIVRDAELHWAWSDTCCINQANHFVLQEALVSMFSWYQGSSLTIVFLRGVCSPSQRGDLTKSVWNTRAWTLQEYHASKVVRFYNEDWTLYMNLDVPNHKVSREIISEMEKATGVSAKTLTGLQPGLDCIREKLCLASGRKTTLREDTAYSLFGIFSVSFHVIYGEGDHALGRLLARLLTNAGDTSVLAWTGRSGSFNSCLPAEISVFSELQTVYIPLAVEDTKMDEPITKLRASPIRLASVINLYDRLRELSLPSFIECRMKIPCITFPLGRLRPYGNKSEPVFKFRGRTVALGDVEITTRESFFQFDSLILVHPWIDFLLDRPPIGGIPETVPEPVGERLETIMEDEGPTSLGGPSPPHLAPSGRPGRLRAWWNAHVVWPFGKRLSKREPSLRPPSTVLQSDKELQALRVLARLQQPFGALLFARTRPHIAEYRRVASESMIKVRVKEITPEILDKLVNSVQMLDVV